MVHVLGLQLWGEIRIPKVLGSNTKTSSLSYLAGGAHRPPLTPLKYQVYKVKVQVHRCEAEVYLPPASLQMQLQRKESSGLLENYCAMLEHMRYTW